MIIQGNETISLIFLQQRCHFSKGCNIVFHISHIESALKNDQAIL